MASKAQAEALKRMHAGVTKALGKDAGVILGGNASARSQVRFTVPTGIDVVDRYLLMDPPAQDGTQGIPGGRAVEIAGPEGSGKTTLAMTVAGNWQRRGGVVHWVDSENGWDENRARALGMDLTSTLLTQPSMKAPLEECIDQMRITMGQVGKKEILLTIWDSVASSPTEEEMEKDASEGVSMARGAQIGRACRALTLQAANYQATLLFVNQLREKVGKSYGSPFYTPGGKGMKFAVSASMLLMGGEAVKDGEQRIGSDVLFKMGKNRFALPFQQARVRLLFKTGYDNDWSTFNHAKDRGLLPEGEKFTPENVALAKQVLGW